MIFLRRLFGLSMIAETMEVTYRYRRLCEKQQGIIERQQIHNAVNEELVARYQDEMLKMQQDNLRSQLEHVRSVRDLVEHFFIAQEAGLDVRDELEAGLRDLQDEVARQEEFTPTRQGEA